MRGFTRYLFVALVLGALAASGAMAAATLNLADLTTGADKIFRGRVFEANPGSIQTAAGEIPTTTYLIRVDDAFQGDFEVRKGFRVVEIVTAGSAKVALTDEQAAVLPPAPEMEVGQSYLLFTTAADAHGLTSTVGAGQGVFAIYMDGDQELAFNQLKNRDLFVGMALVDAESSGLNTYAQVANELRATLGTE
jgi:hypothetical protein